MHNIQLIPKLAALETNASTIHGFSFWSRGRDRDFFDFDPASPFKFRYVAGGAVGRPPAGEELRFSNLSYLDGSWHYSSRKFGLPFLFSISEADNSMVVNGVYHRHFIKIGWLEPAGNVLTDYITYKLELGNKRYQDGGAALFGDKTFLILGPGKNFKTTLLNIMLENGGYYIGDEFFLLDGNRVYATMPSISAFDFRESHGRLLGKDLRRRKVDVSDYGFVLFMLHSNKDGVSEIDAAEADRHVRLYHHAVNTHYYSDFRSRDYLLKGETAPEGAILGNRDARYFVIRFTAVENVFKFIRAL